MTEPLSNNGMAIRPGAYCRTLVDKLGQPLKTPQGHYQVRQTVRDGKGYLIICSPCDAWGRVLDQTLTEVFDPQELHLTQAA